MIEGFFSGFQKSFSPSTGEWIYAISGPKINNCIHIYLFIWVEEGNKSLKTELEDKCFPNCNYALVSVGCYQNCILKNCKLRPPQFDTSSYILLEMNLASRLAPAASELLLHFAARLDSLLPFSGLPTPGCRLLVLLGAGLGSHSWRSELLPSGRIRPRVSKLQLPSCHNSGNLTAKIASPSFPLNFPSKQLHPLEIHRVQIRFFTLVHYIFLALETAFEQYEL